MDHFQPRECSVPDYFVVPFAVSRLVVIAAVRLWAKVVRLAVLLKCLHVGSAACTERAINARCSLFTLAPSAPHRHIKSQHVSSRVLFTSSPA